MENASKALLIAGAVLIVILLISLGLVMYNASKGTTESATETATQLKTGAEAAAGQIESIVSEATNPTPDNP